MSMVGKELIQVHGGKWWQWLVIKELIQVHIVHMGQMMAMVGKKLIYNVHVHCSSSDTAIDSSLP